MLSTMYDSVYIKNPEYDSIKEGSELICINFHTGNWIKLNESATLIFNRIGTKTLNEIINDISLEISFEPSVTKTIYDNVIRNLITSKLIINVDNTKELIIEQQNFSSNLSLYPKKIWIHVIDTCNLSCSYCYYNAFNINEKREITKVNTELLFAFLDQIPQEERDSIVISGGEPFLNDQLPEIVKYIKEYLEFKEIKVITNGTVNHNMYKSVLPYIDSLQFSMDGTEPDLHEAIRGKGSYNLLTQGINKAKDLNFQNIQLSYTVRQENVHDLCRLAEFAYENEINNLNINKLLRVGKYAASKDSFSMQLFEETYSEFKRKVLEINTKIYYERETLQAGMDHRRPFINVSNSFDISSKISVAGKLIGCGMGSAMISIIPDGNIYPCPSLHNERLKIGNLVDSYTDIKIRGTEISKEYNVENEKTECYRCKYKYFCGGGCRAEALSNGNIYGKYDDCDCFFSDMIKNIKDF